MTDRQFPRVQHEAVDLHFLSRRLDPLRPERIDHILIGLILFVAMVLSVGLSVLSGWALRFG